MKNTLLIIAHKKTKQTLKVKSKSCDLLIDLYYINLYYGTINQSSVSRGTSLVCHIDITKHHITRILKQINLNKLKEMLVNVTHKLCHS